MTRQTSRLLTIIALLFPVVASAATYTFDALANGNLAGQDSWFLLNGNQTSYVITNGTGIDLTKVAKNPNSVASGADVHFVGRTNNGTYSFGDLTNATMMTLAMDVQVQNNGSQDQFIAFNLINPTHDTYASPAFSFRQSFGAQPTWGLASAAFTGNGGSGTSGTISGTFATNDWIRLDLVMDLTANGGMGSGSLYSTNLTQLGSPQLLISGFNLNLSPTLSKGIWNTMWLRSDFASDVTFDNLTVTFSVAAVPEMNGAWIGGACALLLGCHLIHRRRRVS